LDISNLTLNKMSFSEMKVCFNRWNPCFVEEARYRMYEVNPIWRFNVHETHEFEVCTQICDLKKQHLTHKFLKGEPHVLQHE